MASDSQKTCFLIGPIGSPQSEVRKKADLLKGLIINEVVSKEPFNYEVKRADEIHDPGLITAQVINLCHTADLVIADLTDGNPNAYYELGIAHMAHRAVITLIETGQTIPFDNKDYRTIEYDLSDMKKISETRDQLRERIKRINKRDYKVSNPVTAARGSAKLHESADSRDKLVVDMLEQMNFMNKKLNDQERRINEVEATPFRSTLTISNNGGIAGGANPFSESFRPPNRRLLSEMMGPIESVLEKK